MIGATIKTAWGTALICFVLFPLRASVEMPPVFGDHMVLQRNVKVPIWGIANPGETITVVLNKQELSTLASQEGHWRVDLSPMEAGGPYSLEISWENNLIQYNDILIGEVWLCSGQSNMRWPLKSAENGPQIIPDTDNSQIRLFDMVGSAYPRNVEFSSEQLQRLEDGDYYDFRGWEACSPSTAGEFSTVAHFFGKELYDSLQVPIGLIHNAIGGSPTEAWIGEGFLGNHPQLNFLVKKERELQWPQILGIKTWTAERATKNFALWISEGQTDLLSNHPFAPGYLFKTGIQPLIPFTFRGVIWYQGESNAANPEMHSQVFPLLIQTWRKEWERIDMPFLYVQLPGIGNRNRWPEFRETQSEALSIPGTGMAVIVDSGHPSDVHPRAKQVVGHRLALNALVNIYGRDFEYSGPIHGSYVQIANQYRLKFTHAENLTTKDGGSLKGFTVQGYRDFGKIEVIEEVKEVFIEGNEVVITIPYDLSPTKIKYGWAPDPYCNLVNGADLPASPFKIELPADD